MSISNKLYKLFIPFTFYCHDQRFRRAQHPRLFDGIHTDTGRTGSKSCPAHQSRQTCSNNGIQACKKDRSKEASCSQKACYAQDCSASNPQAGQGCQSQETQTGARQLHHPQG